MYPAKTHLVGFLCREFQMVHDILLCERKKPTHAEARTLEIRTSLAN